MFRTLMIALAAILAVAHVSACGGHMCLGDGSGAKCSSGTDAGSGASGGNNNTSGNTNADSGRQTPCGVLQSAAGRGGLIGGTPQDRMGWSAQQQNAVAECVRIVSAHCPFEAWAELSKKSATERRCLDQLIQGWCLREHNITLNACLERRAADLQNGVTKTPFWGRHVQCQDPATGRQYPGRGFEARCAWHGTNPHSRIQFCDPGDLALNQCVATPD